MTRKSFARPDHQLRSDHGRDQAADHHTGDRPVAIGACEAVRSREAVALHVGTIKAGQEGADAKERKTGLDDTGRRHQTGCDAKDCPKEITRPAAEPEHHGCRRKRSDSKPEIEQTDRQGGGSRV